MNRKMIGEAIYIRVSVLTQSWRGKSAVFRMSSSLTSHGYSKSIKVVRRQRNLGLHTGQTNAVLASRQCLLHIIIYLIQTNDCKCCDHYFYKTCNQCLTQFVKICTFVNYITTITISFIIIITVLEARLINNIKQSNDHRVITHLRTQSLN